SSVPTGPVQYHENIVLTVTLRDFSQKQRHGFGIDLRQNQGIQHAVMGTGGSKQIGVLPHDLHRNFRSYAWRGPTTSRLVDPPKAGLVLEHQPEGSVFLADDLGDEPGKFFLKARCRCRLTSG